MEFAHLPEHVRKVLTETGAFQEGHFKLSSGLHSRGYLQCALILQHPATAAMIAEDLALRFRDKKPDVVLSPALGGIILGHELARALGCRGIFAERKDGEMLLRRGFYLKQGEKVLLAEDVVTTGGSVQELRRIVDEKQAVVVGYTAVCDRSSGRFAPTEKLDPWITLSIETFEQDKCPLCAEGVPMDKPGSRWQ